MNKTFAILGFLLISSFPSLVPAESLCALFLDNIGLKEAKLTPSSTDVRGKVLDAFNGWFSSRMNELPNNIQNRVTEMVNEVRVLERYKEPIPGMGTRTFTDDTSGVVWNIAQKKLTGFYVSSAIKNQTRALIIAVQEIEHIVDYAFLEQKIGQSFVEKFKKKHDPSSKFMRDLEKRGHGAAWDFYSTLRRKLGVPFDAIATLAIEESGVSKEKQDLYLKYMKDASVTFNGSISVDRNLPNSLSEIVLLELWDRETYMNARVSAYHY